MKEGISIREWQKQYKEGAFSSLDRDTQIRAGWYEWFCPDVKLSKKTVHFGNVIGHLKDSARVDLDQMFVWFVNNQPYYYARYDDFRISSKKTGDMLYAISYKESWYGNEDLWIVHAVCEGLVSNLSGRESYKSYGFRTTEQLICWLNATEL